MAIARQARIGGTVIVGVVAGTMLMAAAGMHAIRINGPLHAKTTLLADFKAEILPPSLYLVDPMLEVSRAVRRPELVGEVRERLAPMERAYRANRDRFAASELDLSLKADLASGAARAGDAFWLDVDSTILPALERGDVARAQQGYAELEGTFARHRAAIQRLAEATDRADQAVRGWSATIVLSILAFLALAAMIAVSLLVLGLRMLLARAIAPLGTTARTMTAMADGDLEAGRTESHRDDEIGEMTRAIEVFREAAIRQRDDAGTQARVVATMAEALDHLAAGNLTHRIAQPLPEEYESIRGGFNTALEALDRALIGVSQSAQNVNVSAEQIRSTSEDLAHRNARQASGVQEAAAGMTQMTGLVSQTAERTGEVSATAAAAHSEATAGGRVVAQAVEAMAEIERSSREVTQIVTVIDGIAFQTNLLALNAGVEAARAGKSGRGFAVVANEVRALAQRSAEAAADIKALIEASTRHVATGVARVGETGELLQRIVGQVGQVNGTIGEIAAAASGQTTGLEKVSDTVRDMGRMTEQNAAMAEETTAAARSLANEAATLAGLVDRFAISAAPRGSAERRLAA